MDIDEAIILAGGKGTRLRSVTLNKIPKGLTKIRNKPILEWELDWLAREGVKRVILAVGHLAEIVEDHFKGGYHSNFGEVEVIISPEKEKLGSGGAFKQASSYITSDRCYVVNGDVLTNCSLERMRQIHKQEKALATMLLVNMVSPYGIVQRKNLKITQFLEKPRLDVQIHAGVDIIEKSIFSRFPDKGQMEETIFVELANSNQFASYLMSNDDFWMSVDTEKDYTTANENWSGLS